jgi:hypothetical protein
MAKKNPDATLACADTGAHLGELTPVSCKYINSNEVRVTMSTAAGDLVSYTLRAKMLVQSINQLVGLIHNNFATIDIEF